MTSQTQDVKRSYDSSRRQERARRSRLAVLEAAERLFLRDGYAPTTVAAIAAEAGVSADTIYKAFVGKAGLVRAIRDRALEGEGTIPADVRSDELQARETDPRKLFEEWGRFVAEITPRVSPILLLIRDAATTDAEVSELYAEMDADRLRRMTENARRLRAAGHLRAGVSVAAAADVLWTYTSAELYELLVLRRRWTPKRYGRFAAEAMAEALL